MNIIVCLELGNIKWVTKAAGQKRICAEYAVILFFSIAFFV